MQGRDALCPAIEFSAIGYFERQVAEPSAARVECLSRIGHAALQVAY
jgi:hypothetical protein